MTDIVKDASLFHSIVIYRWLGHKDIETTENYYISSTDENKKNVSNVFDRIMNSEVIKEVIKYGIG